MKKLNNIITDIKILYVEDEESIREATYGILEDIFKMVVSAANGFEALEIFKEHNDFDIIVTDINMPKMNGIELIEEIRNIDINFPISITTAHSENHYLFKAINLGVNGYIVKPINAFNLIQTISNAVEGKYLRKELENRNDNLFKDLKRTSFELNTILNTQDNLIAILNKNNIHLLNNQFLNFLGKNNIQEVKNDIKSLSELFILEKGDFYIDTDDILESLNMLMKQHNNNIYIKMKNKYDKEEVFTLDIKTYEYDGLNYIFTFTNVTKFKEETDTLKYKVDHDNLTGLFNKEYFNSVLKEEINRSIRYNHKFTLGILDLDFFKKINDTYGHDIGDDVLINLSNTLKNFLRETDIVCRWGGEEFIVLLPETTINEAYNKLDRLRVLIKNKNLSSNINEQITVSCGMCEFEENDTSKSIFKKADLALYEAKKTGRNKIIIA